MRNDRHIRTGASANTFQIGGIDVVVGTDGQLYLSPDRIQVPHSHVHIFPYYTPAWRTDSCIVGARAAGMRMGGPLWSPVRCLHPSLSLKCIGPCGTLSGGQ